MHHLDQTILNTLPFDIAKSLVIFFIAWAVGKYSKHFLNKYVKPKTHSPYLIDFLGTALHRVILLLALMPLLSTLGINVSGIVAGLGLTGFALGFALKDTLTNIIAGIFILLYRPFKLKTYIKVATSKSLSDEGYVKEIDLRYTTVENKDEIILIPNAMLFTNSITIFKNPPRLTEEK